MKIPNNLVTELADISKSQKKGLAESVGIEPPISLAESVGIEPPVRIQVISSTNLSASIKPHSLPNTPTYQNQEYKYLSVVNQKGIK